MTRQDYNNELEEMLREYELKRKKVMKRFCDANNPYKIGDKFTDHIGSIIIEKIKYSHTINGTPCCVYFGIGLKKDGTPKKSNDKRHAWQTNDVSVFV
jgi:hypothetical protein